MINKYGNIPLYSQLKDLIIQKIQNGEYTQESKIPSEQELCEIYDISRPTVRQAINELTSSGYLYKEKGKGTFVARTKARIDIKNYSGFTDSILDSQIPGERNILSIEVIKSELHKNLEDLFNITYNQKIEFAVIKYILMQDKDVFSLNTSYLPLNLFPNIIDDIKSKKQSFDILRGKYPLVPVKSKSSLEVLFTEQSDAGYLQVQPGLPYIKIENILLSKSGQVVEYIICKYKADKCKLLFEHSK